MCSELGWRHLAKASTIAAAAVRS